MAKTNLKKKLQFWGTGRRKKAIARVRLIPGGNGSIVISGIENCNFFIDDHVGIIAYPLGSCIYALEKIDPFVRDPYCENFVFDFHIIFLLTDQR